MYNVRDDFPIFQRTISGKPLIFLDSAASAQKPHFVIDAMVELMVKHYANVHRGLYTLSQEVTEMVEQSRRKVADFIHALPDEIVFTRNATESINLVAYSWGRHFLQKGDVVVLSEMEHHANIVPWQRLRDEIGIVLYWIPVSDDGLLALDVARRDLQSQPVKLVSITHVSNVLGTVNPVHEITSWAHALGARVLIDGAQAVPSFSVDVSAIDCDWYVFSGHKLYGPSGVGVLFGKRALLDLMPPFLGGGDMIVSVTKERSTFQQPPYKFEAGTPAIVDIVGLGAAVDYISRIGMDCVYNHLQELIAYTYPRMVEIPGLTLYGPRDFHLRVGVFSFALSGIHPHDVAGLLDEAGIAIRSGHHCAQVICERLGHAALSRVSFGIYTSFSDIDIFIARLRNVIDVFS